MDNFLSAFSINQNVLECVVIFGLLALVFGTILVMFWRYIVAGLAAVFCVVVLANHKTPQTPVPETTPVKVEQSLAPTEKVEEKPPAVTPVPPVVEVKPEPEKPQLDEHQAFLIDCMRLTNYEYETCDEMWINRENGLQDAKYHKGKNRMMKVAKKL